MKIHQLAINKKKTDSETPDENSSENQDTSDDEFNPTLAAMESEIKPKILKTINSLTKELSLIHI